MHSISATLIKPFSTALIKPLAKLICIALLFITQTAHADFRKALDAYQARDGATMLKEVKDAVDKKNDDGLILFISAMDIDYLTSILSSFDAFEEAKNRKNALSQFAGDSPSLAEARWVQQAFAKEKSTWETILDKNQQKQLFDSLDHATSQSKVEARYKFIHSAIYMKYMPESKQKDGLDEELNVLANKGSTSAAMDLYYLSITPEDRYNHLLKAANNGSPDAASRLAIECYSGANQVFPNLLECKTRNEKLIFHWLTVALLNQDRNPHWIPSNAASKLAELYLNGFDEQQANVREAYLWEMYAIKMGYGSDLIDEIHEKGLLKQADTEFGELLAASWNDSEKRQALLATASSESELPKLLRTKKYNIGQPIFTFNVLSIRLPKQKRAVIGTGLQMVDIYADGKVNLSFGYMDSHKENVETAIKLNKRQLKRFINEVKAFKIESWGSGGFATTQDCYNCGRNQINLTVVSRLGKGETYYRTSGGEFTSDPISSNFTRLTLLIEKYVPTVQLRCSIGSSEAYRQSCLNFYQSLKN